MTKQWLQHQQNAKSAQNGQKAGGEDVALFVVLVQTKADDTVDDATGNQRQQKVAHLHHQVDRAIFCF